MPNGRSVLYGHCTPRQKGHIGEHPPPPLRCFLHSATIAALCVAAQPAASAPAPRSDVAWGDSATNWLDMLVRVAAGGELRPYITIGLLQEDISDEFEVHTARWTGSQWSTDIVLKGLDGPPKAVTAWRQWAAPTPDEMIYAYHDGAVGFADLKWLARDTENAVTTEGPWEFGPVKSTVRPSIAIRNQDNEPAAVWYTQPPGELAGTWYARWDGLDVTGWTHLTDCSGDWPTLILDGGDGYHVSCRSQVAADHFDINYVNDSNDDGIPDDEMVFGAADDHEWRYPAMAFLNGYPAIVAYDADTAKTTLRVKTAGGWGAPVVLATGPGAQHLSIDARSDGAGGGTVAVNIMAGSELWYTEYTLTGGVGSQSPLRRLDLNRDTTGACEGLHHASVVKLPDGDQAVATWFVKTNDHFVGNLPVFSARFTQFRREDTLGWELGIDRGVPEATSIALDADGDGWTCYFGESPDDAAKVDLFVRLRDDLPLRVDQDVGLPSDPRARGCDVAVAPDGRLGVVWADSTLDGIEYRERVGGVFNVGFSTLIDGIDMVAATGHLALAFDADSTAHVLFKRLTLDDNPWLASRDGGGWDFDQVDTYKGGEYPDITFLGESPTPLMSYTLEENGGSVTFARRVNGIRVYTDMAVGDLSVDTSISARVIDNTDTVAVGWVNVHANEVQFAWVVGGINGVYTLDDSERGNAYVAIQLDAAGEVAATWRKDIGEGDYALRHSSVRPFSGGRSLPGPPEPKRINCDLREMNAGTDLELDRFDNPRIMHRNDIGISVPNHDLYFFTRP